MESLEHSLSQSVKFLVFIILIFRTKLEFQATRKDFEGDITLVLFPLLKIDQSKPGGIGK